MVLVSVPVTVPSATTRKEMVQLPVAPLVLAAAGMVALAIETVLVPATAVNVAPAQVVEGVDELDIFMPAGKVSVRPAPVMAVKLRLLKVIVAVE